MTREANSRGLPCHASSRLYNLRTIPVLLHDTIQTELGTIGAIRLMSCFDSPQVGCRFLLGFQSDNRQV